MRRHLECVLTSRVLSRVITAQFLPRLSAVSEKVPDALPPVGVYWPQQHRVGDCPSRQRREATRRPFVPTWRASRDTANGELPFSELHMAAACSFLGFAVSSAKTYHQLHHLRTVRLRTASTLRSDFTCEDRRVKYRRVKCRAIFFCDLCP